MKYTIETLKEINPSYNAEHRVTQSDVIKANQWVKFIEETRDSNKPKAGDIVIFTDSYGYYFPNANIDDIEEDVTTITALPQTPFVGKKQQEKEFMAGTSGSLEYKIPVELKYVGKKEKVFQDWGHCRATENGTIEFFAEVNVWEYSETDSEFTTKDYDRFHLYINKIEDTSAVEYIVSSGGSSKTYFTEEEFQTWLKTYRGVIKDSYDESNKTIWTFKHNKKRVSLEEYENNQDAIIDREMWNGKIYECKRAYSETSVTTYLPPFGEKVIS
ncbi:DUF4121 family protein [Bacillus bombysepticus]|uniref:DUF4121 family protein n=1 Tax=Bacillus bombysepticus TaxID=658666 RepID=UPI003018A9D3